MERKKIGQIKGRMRGEGWFAIPQYSMSSSICIPNMTLLACKVVEKSLTKKCYGITEGRTDGRMDGMMDRCKPVYPPLFQSGGIIIMNGPYVNVQIP